MILCQCDVFWTLFFFFFFCNSALPNVRIYPLVWGYPNTDLQPFHRPTWTWMQAIKALKDVSLSANTEFVFVTVDLFLLSPRWWWGLFQCYTANSHISGAVIAPPITNSIRMHALAFTSSVLRCWLFLLCYSWYTGTCILCNVFVQSKISSQHRKHSEPSLPRAFRVPIAQLEHLHHSVGSWQVGSWLVLVRDSSRTVRG